VTDAVETPEPQETVEPETDWRAEAEKLKAESRKWEARSKENAKAAQRLAELEDADKTELQRATERAETLERELSGLRSQQQVTAWMSEVAASSGVPVDVLRGSTREEIEAHAETLKPLLNPRGPYVPSPGGIPETPTNADAAFAHKLFTQS